ncbi:chemotaxis protein CheA [Pararhizobium mangrovi]|uniref:Chemotaxis protein CheA n=1 Tax=Pararhizobium mangrovi TaxID=2590452 RepID=A0A506U7F5_9HYPH|nr:chemotaxis protein CheA [Pararhizobium mangrovi]TPW29031.1 chemotaxis protein CheA [Pararhizobium mangrovi]
MDAMEAIRQTFFEECAEQLVEVETGLLAFQDGEADDETIDGVFRGVHSIKGGAGAFHLDALVAFAHAFETVLDELRSKRIEPDETFVRLTLRSADALSDLVAAARDGETADTAKSDALLAELEAVTGSADEKAEADEDGFAFQPVTVDVSTLFGAEAGETTYTIAFRPHDKLYARANDSMTFLRELSTMGEMQVTCDTEALPLLADIDPEAAYFGFVVTLTGTLEAEDIRAVFEFVEDDCELQIDAASTDDADASFEMELATPDEADLLVLQAMLDGTDQDEEAIEATDEHASFADTEGVGAGDPDTAPESALESDPAQSGISRSSGSEAGKREPEPSRQQDPEPAKDPSVSTPAGGKKEAGKPTKAAAGQTIRVDLDRVDRLIDLVGELVIHQVMLSQRAVEAGLTRTCDVATGFEELEQLTRELQDSVMAIRAQPVKSVFQRLPRLVREVAEIAGKRVRLVTQGEWTEVDKTIIEKLSDPLTHMIRNAIDHGLETPEDRVVAGKPEEGTVRVSAGQRSGRIVIEIGDDGAGIKRDKVRDIAIEKGLVSPAAKLTDDEIDNLIFMPGFSTASGVSELSGRGVGMDVVRQSIQSLGGRVTITSEPGKGSKFTMSLPLTLAVLDGMIVTAGDETIVVPLSMIVETMRPKATEVRRFGGEARLINVRDRFLPLIDVGLLLGYRDRPGDPTAGVVILVEMENGDRAALLVDGIQGQRQVVIKSTETNYGMIPGVGGATILGDGRVALILDVDRLVTCSREAGHSLDPATLQAAE